MEDKENRFYGFTNKFLIIVGMLARRFCGGISRKKFRIL